MKITIAITLICLCLVPTQQLSLSGDFITGFESGIFLRANPKMLDDYGCPTPKQESDQMNQF